MSAHSVWMAVGAFAAAASSAAAQNAASLYLVKTQDLAPLCRAQIAPGAANPDNRFWIGTSPTCIAYGRGRLMVGGRVDAGGGRPLDGADADGDGVFGEVSPFDVAIVKINNVLTAPSLSTVSGSRVTAAIAGCGYTGMDYAPSFVGSVPGLVASLDPMGPGPNQVTRYDVDRAGDGVLLAPSPSLYTGFRVGSCGPAWDFGPAGLGVDYAPIGAPDGVPDGPVVAVAMPGEAGPFGLHPLMLNAGLGATLYEAGFANGPRLAPAGEGVLTWRDLSIDPRNGAIAARAEHTVVYCTRTGSGAAVRIDLSPSDASTERLIGTGGGPPTVMQHVAILTGFGAGAGGVGDLLVWNDAGPATAGTPFASAVRFNKTERPGGASGAAITVSVLNSSGSPAALPPGNGEYDFFWDQATRLLVVCDTFNKAAYFLSEQQPGSCCTPLAGCVLLNASACVSPEVGGTPGLAGSTCTPGLCPPAAGACCTGSSCSVVTPAGCAGSFRGAATACDFPGNPVTCCRANFNEVGGVTVQDVFDYLQAYFGGSPGADFNGSGAVSVQDIFDFLQAYFTGCAG